ncbi:MAG: hypothetical protein P0Y62_01340 [Candidatus Chryseobacterium colombiense]|nr:hypothetical protein [Chryseobacterium sp.]WEK70198.1 MAG: hypothetical protein P0Y62_01340 [Chryseobacterium sp.]
MKFGIIFYAILGILVFLLGVYLLQYSIPISLIFFIGTFINGVFIYKEYSVHKNEKIEYNENTPPEEVIIKYSRSGRIIAITMYSIFMILGLFFLVGIRFKLNGATIFALIILSGFTGYFIFKIITEVKKYPKLYSLSMEKEYK